MNIILIENFSEKSIRIYYVTVRNIMNIKYFAPSTGDVFSGLFEV